ncbi:hypothetical protein U1Q18_042737, partial [Sarracenia purpurea var. burkii]
TPAARRESEEDSTDAAGDSTNLTESYGTAAIGQAREPSSSAAGKGSPLSAETARPPDCCKTWFARLVQRERRQGCETRRCDARLMGRLRGCTGRVVAGLTGTLMGCTAALLS